MRLFPKILTVVGLFFLLGRFMLCAQPAFALEPDTEAPQYLDNVALMTTTGVPTDSAVDFWVANATVGASEQDTLTLINLFNNQPSVNARDLYNSPGWNDYLSTAYELMKNHTDGDFSFDVEGIHGYPTPYYSNRLLVTAGVDGRQHPFGLYSSYPANPVWHFPKNNDYGYGLYDTATTVGVYATDIPLSGQSVYSSEPYTQYINMWNNKVSLNGQGAYPPPNRMSGIGTVIVEGQPGSYQGAMFTDYNENGPSGEFIQLFSWNFTWVASSSSPSRYMYSTLTDVWTNLRIGPDSTSDQYRNGWSTRYRNTPGLRGGKTITECSDYVTQWIYDHQFEARNDELLYADMIRDGYYDPTYLRTETGLTDFYSTTFGPALYVPGEAWYFNTVYLYGIGSSDPTNLQQFNQLAQRGGDGWFLTYTPGTYNSIVTHDNNLMSALEAYDSAHIGIITTGYQYDSEFNVTDWGVMNPYSSDGNLYNFYNVSWVYVGDDGEIRSDSEIIAGGGAGGTVEEGIRDGTIGTNLAPRPEWARHFPFSIPFDIQAVMYQLRQTPVAPHFSIPFPDENGELTGSYDIDLSPFNNVAKALRTMLDILFTVICGFWFWKLVVD